jgi:hypothetical protein
MEHKLGSILTFRNNCRAKGAENSAVSNETKFSFKNIIGNRRQYEIRAAGLKFSANTAISCSR